MLNTISFVRNIGQGHTDEAINDMEQYIEETQVSTRSIFDLFSDISAKQGEQGALLYGLRMRENLN